jgi:methionyl-tRNA formyltransferase
VTFERVDNWILLGGEDLILNTAIFLREKKQLFLIVTGKRNLRSMLYNGKTLEQNFKINKLKFHISDDVNNDSYVQDYINEYTIGLSLSSPWIFKDSFIKKIQGRLINLHEADLPCNRGGATLSWMIMLRTKKSASTLHFVSPGIDKGDIILKTRYDFPKSLNIPVEYAKFIFSKSILLINRFIENVLSDKTFKPISQENGKSTYWPRLNTDVQGYINWEWDIDDIISFISAFDNPYPGARSFIGNKIILIKTVKKITENFEFHPFQHGIVYRKHNNKIFVATNGGGLEINNISDEKGKDYNDKIKIGDRIFTPNEVLEKSYITRPVYSSKGLK